MSTDDDHPPSRRRAAAPADRLRPKTRHLRVQVSDEWGGQIDSGAVADWLCNIAPARARGDVNIAVVRDATSRALNHRYRGRDMPTDVLSFPSLPADAPARRQHGSRWLGDIVIAKGVARRQARAAGHSEEVELRVLALHGLLHLLGYDHERDHGRMARFEARLRRKGGLHEGLIERQDA